MQVRSRGATNDSTGKRRVWFTAAQLLNMSIMHARNEENTRVRHEFSLSMNAAWITSWDLSLTLSPLAKLKCSAWRQIFKKAIMLLCNTRYFTRWEAKLVQRYSLDRKEKPLKWYRKSLCFHIICLQWNKIKEQVVVRRHKASTSYLEMCNLGKPLTLLKVQ